MSYNILVPTDFSSTAEKAFLYALDIASKCAGTVFLYHVHTPLESPFIETVEVRREYNLENQQSLMNDLHALRSKWAQKYQGAKVITVLGRSPLVGSVLKFTEDHNINLVVMGTQGASGLKKVIIGTIAARMIEKSTVPLLLVPERFEWREPKNVVLATDYDRADIAALKVSAGLAQQYDAFIEVVHLADMFTDREQMQITFDKYIAGLKMKFPKLKFAASLMYVQFITDALETLHQYMPYDILVMVKHKRKFLEQIFMKSATKHMAYLTWKPLLVIPVKEVAAIGEQEL